MISKTKKIFFVIFGLFISLGMFTFAQENISGSDGNFKTVEADLSQPSVQGAISDVNQISASLCDNQSSFIRVIPGQEKDICLEFSNNNVEDIYIASDFFETQFTVAGNPTCSSSNPDNLFTKSMLDRNVVSRVKVPAKSFIQKSIKVNFPLGSSGLYHFCHYYKVDGGGSSIPMFNIVVKKQNLFDIFVNTENLKIAGSVKISNFQRSGENLSFSMKNLFPFDQEISFYATISNIFGFKKEIILDNEIVKYNSSKNFNININDLPYYKGPFSLDIKIKYKPYFTFDVSNSLDANILAGGEMNQKMNFFIFDKVQLIMLAVLFILIFLIKMAFFTKPKVVYVNQENNQKDLNKTL